MRRAMSYVAPWAGVTALAVALSWLGVRGVVRGTVAERSAPPPISGPIIHSSPPTNIGSPTSRPSPPADEDEAPGPSRSPKAPPGDPERERKTSDAKPDDNVRSCVTHGGRAVLSIEKNRVRLVSATPEPGYETRVTQAGGWLRVDFLGEEHTSSVVATWSGGDPAVKVYEY